MQMRRRRLWGRRRQRQEMALRELLGWIGMPLKGGSPVLAFVVSARITKSPSAEILSAA